MKIRYAPLGRDFPPLSPIKPRVPEAERTLARGAPPSAVPAHCKPWLDANSHGLLLTFPYRVTLTITGVPGGLAEVRMTPEHAPSLVQVPATPFARGYVGVLAGYRVATDPGIGVYTGILPEGYTAKPGLVPGLVETWWYPFPLFLVFHAPEPGATMTFAFGDPLCVLMPVVCEPVDPEPMTIAEIQHLNRQMQAYRSFEQEHAGLAWTSAEGRTFSHAYRELSKRQRAEPRT